MFTTPRRPTALAATALVAAALGGCAASPGDPSAATDTDGTATATDGTRTTATAGPGTIATGGTGTTRTGPGASTGASAPAPSPTDPRAPARAPSPTSGSTGTPDPPGAAPDIPPPYVASVRWVTLASGRSLQVRPTAAGRATDALYPEAWSEVRRLARDADTPGMEAQFSCHWTFARLLDADKPSWNLEPWRPVVSTNDMLSAGCNPGGAEE